MNARLINGDEQTRREILSIRMDEKVRLKAQYQSMHQLMGESILKEKDLQKRQLLREQYTEIGLKIHEYTEQIKLLSQK